MKTLRAEVKETVTSCKNCWKIANQYQAHVVNLLQTAMLLTWGQKAVYIRRNLPMVERVFKILKLIVISPHDSIKCQSWEGFEKIAFYHYKKAHFYTVGQNQFF